ncbi:hypothetical protein, partial [Methylomonas rosea]
AGYHIILWDRVIRTPEETEFNVHCSSAKDESFFDWINELNPESNTYQFIIKAIPASNTEESLYTKLDKLDNVDQLVSKLSELNKQNMLLKSKIDWLEKNRFGPFTSLFQKLIRRA